MLIKFFMIFLFTASLYAQNTQILNSKEYQNALSFYKNKNYQKSYDLFNILFKKNLDNPEINFHLGRSAYELKKYNIAIIAYQRVLFQKPNNIRVKFEFARSLLLYKSYIEAQRLFTEIKNNKNTPVLLKKAALTYLEKLESRNSKHHFDGLILVGLNNDSNFENTAEPHTYGSLTYSDSAQKASSHLEVAILNYKYTISDSLTSKNTFLLLNKAMFNDKHKSKNLKLFKFTPTLIKKHSSKNSSEYSFFVDSFYEENINTIKSSGLNVKFNHLYNSKNRLSTFLKYQKRNYQISTDQDKNTKTYELSSSLSNLYSKQIINTYTASIIKENKEKGQRSDISNKSYAFTFQNKYIYNNSFNVKTFLSYKKTKYKDITAGYNVRKKNTLLGLGLSATYAISPKLIFQANVNYNKQNSNVLSNVYNKNTFAINLIRPF
ncbi:MAG: hypothetical protein COA66_11230 [Arcobacter sp.]|nr:MAG: hypothetical protein COA66_11230 [Arcobacter sp.]